MFRILREHVVFASCDSARCVTVISAASYQSLLDDPETARRGLVLPDRFIKTLEENSVFFPRKTARALVAQFQAPSGAVQVAKFLKWIELSRPADYVDPELVFARLPQPYRRIVKVLERDILDAAWELIKEQSTRFKAETAAALAATARSNHALGIAASELIDDGYDSAKKRCCKTFAAQNYDETQRIAAIAQHETLPVVLVALEDHSRSSSDDSGNTTSQSNAAVLQLLHTLTHDVVAEYALPVPQSPDAPASSEPATNTRAVYEVASVTPIRVRPATLETAAPALVVAVQLTLSTTTTVSIDDELSETTTQATCIYVFEITGVDALLGVNDVGAVVLSTEPQMSFELIATGTFDYVVAWLELSPDARFLALPTALGAVSVLSLSHESATEQDAPPPPLDCSAASTVFLTIELDANTTRHEAPPPRAHFLAQPSSVPDTTPPATLEPREAYALIVCSDTHVRKHTLPRARSSAATAALTITWRHVAPITSSALDATTQYLVVGLANGAVVVWDTLQELDYAYLSPAPAAAVTTPRDTVDSVVMYRTEYVVAFSAATQRVRFFDIRKRIEPVLVRTVTAPAPSGGGKSDSNSAVQIVSVAATTNSLDVPLAMLTYSNGTHILYDLRTGEAVGSLRTRILSSPLVASPVLLSPCGVVAIAQTAALAIYDWLALLSMSYPTLAHELQQSGLAQSALNAKRWALTRVPLAPLTTLADVAADALDNLLRRTAGVPLVSASLRQQQQVLPPSSSLASLASPDPRQANRLGPSASSASISSTPPTRAGTSTSSSRETLEDLAVALAPRELNAPMRFCQYVLDLDTSVTKDKDAKMHRRRTELLKALTTGAW